jgi:hypothetical protein
LAFKTVFPFSFPMNISSGSPHHEAIARIRATLEPGSDGEIYLISQQHPQKGVIAGRMSCNTVAVAALMIYQGTHRVANDAEVLKWQADQAERKKQIEHDQAKRDTKYQIIVQAPSAAPAVEVTPLERLQTPLRPPKSQQSTNQNA